jgi:hypothetical protein
MALTLPYPDMNFVPLDVLTAAEQNQLVANIEFLADNSTTSELVFSATRLRVYVDGTNGDDNNDGLSTATPKQTIAGAFTEINKHGGSANIRFLTAGTYNLSTGFLNSANIVFEKNASSIGDVTINFTGVQHYENSIFTFTTMILTGSEVRFWNSFVQFTTDCSIECLVTFYGSSSTIYSTTIKNKIVARDGSSLYMNGFIIDPLSSITSGNIITSQNGSKVSIGAAAASIKTPPEGNSIIFLNLIDGELYISDNFVMNDLQGETKIDRGMAITRAIAIYTHATQEMFEALAVRTTYVKNALRIYSSGQIGA